MSKKTVSPGRPGEEQTAAEAVIEPVRKTTFSDQMEQQVWTKSSRPEQYRVFTELLDYHVGGICRETILAEELFLMCVCCREHNITGERLSTAINCYKTLFEGMEKKLFLTQKEAFDRFREVLTSSVHANGASANTNEKLTIDDAHVLIDYATTSIFSEFDLFAAVFGYPMDSDIVNERKHMRSPMSKQAPLSSATYRPMSPEKAAPDPLADKKAAIIARMIEIDVAKAEGEIESTVSRHQVVLDSKLQTLRSNLAEMNAGQIPAENQSTIKTSE